MLAGCQGRAPASPESSLPRDHAGAASSNTIRPTVSSENAPRFGASFGRTVFAAEASFLHGGLWVDDGVQGDWHPSSPDGRIFGTPLTIA
jgi:hypothetical protein